MFSTVDPRQLASISGGRKSASDLVLDKLTDRFPVGLGFVSYIGDPNVSATKKRGVEHVTGNVDVNRLWNGDTHHSFSADANTKTGAVTGLRTKLLPE